MCVPIQMYVCTHVFSNIDHETMTSYEQESKQLTAIPARGSSQVSYQGTPLYTSLPAAHTLLPQCPFIEPRQWPMGLPEELVANMLKKKTFCIFF